MMSLVCLMTMALALASTTSSLRPPVQDQYAAFHRFGPKKFKGPEPDLQVGCADGNVLHDKSLKRTPTHPRRRRSYVPWTYSNPYTGINVWKPPVYSLERPYFIPIYGIAGRTPIYFPPQPLNPGTPKDNPKRFQAASDKYQGPQYLPPKEEVTTKMPLFDKFNGGDNYDDRPIWDFGGGQVFTTEASVVPTRGPMPPPEALTPPPLVHNPTNGEARPSSSDNEVEDFPTLPAGKPSGGRPVTKRPEPTRCVWAIISCCSAVGEISYDCFEQRGCPGSFWDKSPCDSDFAKAAVAAALNYYN